MSRWYRFFTSNVSMIMCLAHQQTYMKVYFKVKTQEYRRFVGCLTVVNCDVTGSLRRHQKAVSCLGWDKSISETRSLSRSPGCTRHNTEFVAYSHFIFFKYIFFVFTRRVKHVAYDARQPSGFCKV